jgi:hypothetical protein
MCAIVGSFNTETLHTLITLNSYRGCHSYSFSLYDTYLQRLTVHKKALGEVDISSINVPPRSYGIVHVQAPTTSSITLDSVHPACLGPLSSFTINKDTKHEEYDQCLWHNGIIKADCVKELQKRNGVIDWDTRLMLLELYAHGWYSLDRFDGSFSCLYYSQGGLYLFRNEISPMFIDSDLNISSTKFAGSTPTEANKVLKIEHSSKTAAPIFTFKTVENPYYFAEEDV